MRHLATLVVVVTGLPACHRSAEQGRRSAVSTETVAVGGRPIDLAAGDVDGDGDLDLVVADAGGRAVSVWLRESDGWRAAPGEPVDLGLAAHMVALGDVDADRDLDLFATAHDSGAVAVALGDGRGGFRSAPGSPFAAFAAGRPHNHGLAVGDLDGDGDADVVVADQMAGAAAALLGDGRGGLTPAPGSPVEVGGQTYPPALGKIDGDGRLDLVVPIVGGQAIAVLLGDGAGGFRPAGRSPIRAVRERPYGVAIADLNGDGASDLIVAHDDTDVVALHLGDGRGGFDAGRPVDLGLRIWRPSAADVNGDGHVDLVGAGSGHLVVAPGDGAGGLRAPARIAATSGWNVLVADLDGDGRTDIAAPDPDQGVLWIGRAMLEGAELVGRPAGEWTFSDWSDGSARTLADLRGRVVVVRFWTAGCPFCEKSMPALQKLAEELHDRPVTFIGAFHAKPIESERDMSEPLALAKQSGVTFPLALDRKWRTLRAWWLDGADRAATSCTFVIGKDGRIVHVHPGPMYYPSDDPAAARENRDYQALRSAILAALAE